MADYKIANIKWLRDQGWEISSSYADSMCPTYNEIVNEIPKGSITVDVSGTYSNNQLVCEKDINIITGKFVTLALSNGNVIDIEGSGALTTSMVRDYQQTTVKAEIGTLCTSLEGSVFTSFENLTGATISDTVTSIGINPFVNCTSLTSIIIDSNNTTYDSRNNCNAIIETSTNTLIQGCKSTVIPNTVTSIGQNAFMAQKTLTGITIPNSVTSIDVSAFQACEGLTNMVIPTSVTTIGNNAFSGCKNITTCTMGNGVTSIGSGAFTSCTSLTSITLSNTLETINSGAFAGCTSLPSITIPESVTNIGGGVLTACTSLERITVEAVTPCTISNNAFASSNDCPIYVPCESVTTYKTSWSQYADRITCDSVIATLTLNNGSTVDIEGSGVLTSSMIESYRTTVTKAEIKDTCISIGSNAFYRCTSLTSVTIPNSVTSIGDSAFANCNRLTSVTLPNSVATIGATAFASCTGLERITVERVAPPTIENNTFSNTNTCPIYVPCESVNTYKTSWSLYASRITCEGGDETYTVYVTSEPNESSCARVLIADGGSIEFTLSIGVGGTTHTLKYLVNNRQEFGGNLERFGTINVPIGQISSFDFNYLSTDTGNILKANSSSNGNKLPQLTTQWSTLGSNTELWEGGAIPNLCTGDKNGNRFVVSWEINTVEKTITIYYMYQDIN